MKYKILVSEHVTNAPIECESYELGDKGVSYCFEESLNSSNLIGFIPHVYLIAVLPIQIPHTPAP